MVRFAVAAVVATLVFTRLVQAQEEGTYQFKNRHSGKVLAVRGDSKDAGAKIIQDMAKKDNTHQWKLVKVGEYFKIVQPKSGRVLTAPPNPLKEGAGTQAVLDNDSGSKNQQWSLQKHEAQGIAYFAIKSRSAGMVLDVDNASEDAGARVIIWQFNPKGERGNQLWRLVPAK